MASSVSASVRILLLVVLSFAVGTKAPLVMRSCDFEKLLLVWPESFCNTAEDKCQKPIVRRFVISGLRSMINPDTPYYSQTYTTVSSSNITRDFFNSISILGLLDFYWPDIFFYENDTENEKNWKKQWSEYGRFYGKDPNAEFYFRRATYYGGVYKILDLLEPELIYPRNDLEGYGAYDIARVLKKIVGKTIQIRCNHDADGNIQLYEIGICFSISIHDQTIDCEIPYVGCDENDTLLFPDTN